MTIHQEYIYYQNKFENKYGNKVLVLMQVGSFHECYSLGTSGPDLTKISNICDLTLTKRDKKKSVSNKNPYLLGFPSVALDKYIKKLISFGYTIPVIDQVTPPPEPKRELTTVYSPGTYIEENLSSESNNIMSIYIEDEPQIKDKSFIICIGISVTDVSTGKTTVYEIISEKTDKNLACDEAVRFINSFSPNEVVVFRKNSLKIDKTNYYTKENLIDYLELNDKNYIFSTEIDKSWFKQQFKETFLKKIFKTTGIYDTVVEYLDLEKKPYATLSLVFLLEFIYNHNINLLNKISKPEYFNGKKHLILGNNAINQLNIVSSDVSYTGFSRFKSLYDVVNNCYTPVGKRYLKNVLCNPFTCSNKLNETYNFIDTIKTQYLDELIEKISGIIDIERLYRKINIGNIHPHELNEFIKSVKKIKQLFDFVMRTVKIDLINSEEIKKLSKFIRYCDLYFDYDKLEIHKISDISSSLFKKGHHEKIDDIQTKIDEYKKYMDNITAVLSSYIQDSNKDESLKIKLDFNNVDGYFLKTTLKRSILLKKQLSKYKAVKITDKIHLDPELLKYKDLKGGTTKIVYDDLDRVSQESIKLKDEIVKLVFDEYKKELETISDNYSNNFRYISDTLAYIDFCISNAKTAKQYNYTKPKLVNKKYGYIDAKNLRHPIIERINDESAYVPHTIKLGKKKDKCIDGMLIFGLNSSGKSSLMKSVGLSIVMAQTGMFVPAEYFEFSPFNSLFARITGNDNIFKGLSSFALEMVELEAILKRISQKTLVIGDEVCRGTETISGNAIVASTIVELANNKTPFLFATHLHNIPNIKEVKELDNVKCFHLSVETDPKTDKLIFDRELKEGSGENVYGIKVAKHIINHNSFISRAEKIRDVLIEKGEAISKKVSKYNSKIVMDSCKICGKTVKNKNEIPLETHHINYQQNCENGFVKDKPHIPMNSKSNLVVLCKKCHSKEHKGELNIKGYKKTSSGIDLISDIHKSNKT